MNAVAFFEIQSSSPERDMKFYSDVFHWKFVRQEGAPVEYYLIDTPGILGGLLKRPFKIPPPEFGTNAFTCSVEVSDYDGTAARILAHGGMVALPKFAVRGRCWQGYFMDPDNNVFGIFQVDENAR